MPSLHATPGGGVPINPSRSLTRREPEHGWAGMPTAALTPTRQRRGVAQNERARTTLDHGDESALQSFGVRAAADAPDVSPGGATLPLRMLSPAVEIATGTVDRHSGRHEAHRTAGAPRAAIGTVGTR